MIERLQTNSTVTVAAHRGFKSSYPENTIVGFQKALELGVDMLEFDLRLSKDKRVMIIHDETLDRTTNGTGKVRDFTYSELKQLSAGAECNCSEFEEVEIPTLEEFCDLLTSYPDVLLNVEVKPSIDAKEVADATIVILKKYGYLSRCVFTSFDAAIISYLHDTYKVKTQGFPEESMLNFSPGEEGTYSKMWAAGIDMKQLTPEIVKEFQDRGILAWCYCPDNDNQVTYALTCGVTLMTCNNPEPAMKICKK